MYCDASGRPTADGDYELINGKVCVRRGRTISFNHMLMDAGGKPAEPKSIDEALQQAFAAQAERFGYKKVSEWLAQVAPKDLDQIIAEVATQFVRGHAGQGIAKQFARDAVVLSDAERDYRVAAAKARHNLRYAYLGAKAPAFTADAASAATVEATRAVVQDRARHIVNVSDAETDRLRSEYRGALAATKHLASNAWRR